MIRSHRDLVVWQKSMILAVQSYELARKLPPSERYGLAAQLRRAAVSIPSNIAEGVGRLRRRDYARFIAIARGSARELDTQFELVMLCKLVSAKDVENPRKLLDEVCRMLTVLLRRLDNTKGATGTSASNTPDS